MTTTKDPLLAAAAEFMAEHAPKEPEPEAAGEDDVPLEYIEQQLREEAKPEPEEPVKKPRASAKKKKAAVEPPPEAAAEEAPPPQPATESEPEMFPPAPEAEEQPAAAADEGPLPPPPPPPKSKVDAGYVKEKISVGSPRDSAADREGSESRPHRARSYKVTAKQFRDGDYCEVTVRFGMTTNLGNYESSRLDVKIKDICRPDKVEDAVRELKDRCVAQVRRSVFNVQDHLAQREAERAKNAMKDW